MPGIERGSRAAISDEDDFDRMVEAPIAARARLLAHGMATLPLLSRLLLIESAAQIVLRGDRDAAANDDPDGPDGSRADPTKNADVPV